MSHRSPLAVFEAVRILNLPTRSDRRREMRAELARAGCAGDPHVQFFRAIRPGDAGGFPSVGARGCFLSHLAVLEQALAHGWRSLLILEDDASFAAGFAQRMHRLAPRLAAPDWDLFYAGHDSPPGLSPDADGLTVCPPRQRIVTTHCVALSADAIAALVPFLRAMLQRPAGDPQGGPMHVDGAYSTFRAAQPQWRTLIALPPLATQRASRTDVHALAWFDRWPPASAAAGALRRLRNRIARGDRAGARSRP